MRECLRSVYTTYRQTNVCVYLVVSSVRNPRPGTHDFQARASALETLQRAVGASAALQTSNA